MCYICAVSSFPSSLQSCDNGYSLKYLLNLITRWMILYKISLFMIEAVWAVTLLSIKWFPCFTQPQCFICKGQEVLDLVTLWRWRHCVPSERGTSLPGATASTVHKTCILRNTFERNSNFTLQISHNTYVASLTVLSLSVGLTDDFIFNGNERVWSCVRFLI